MRRGGWWMGAWLLAGLAAAAEVRAAGIADGGLDPGFGTAGLAQASIATGSNGRGATIIRQSDGKVIVGGGVVVAGRSVSGMVRFTVDGALDPTFGSGGRVSTAIWNSSSIRALAVQPDGKIVASVGLADEASVAPQAALVRYNADGSLDDSFGDGGLVIVAGTAPWGDALYAIIVQSDGRIVAAGSAGAGIGLSNEVLVIRILADGTPDASFGAGGRLSFGVTADSADVAYALTQQTNGTLVVAGSTAGGGSVNALLARIGSDGTLDPTFGSNGRATLSIGDGSDYLYAVSQLSDGKLVAAGYAASPGGGSDDDVAVIRLSAAGNLDPTFGSAGKTTTQISGNRDRAHALVVQPDGKLVVAGVSLGTAGDNIAVVRYLANGAIDTTFGSNGWVVTSSGSSAGVYGLVIDPSTGALTGGGYTNETAGGRMLAIRYQPSGALDPTFSGDGLAKGEINLVDDYATAIARQTDGKVLVVGVADVGPRLEFAVARFTATGSLDLSYGSGGTVTTAINSSLNSAAAALVQADNKLIAAGSNGGSIALARYTTAGALDPTFGSSGKVQYLISGHNLWTRAAALQSDGKVVVAGTAGVLSEADDEFMVTRFQANGAIDSPFGTRSTPMGSGDAHARAVLVQPDGRIVLAGSADNNFALARYLSSGSLDGTFGTGGRVLSGPASLGFADALALAVQPDGKLVAAGRTFSGGQSDAAFARYTANGAVDTTFGTNGAVVVSAGVSSDAATAVIVQDDGKIVGLGYASDGMTSSLAMVRLTRNGSLDPTFGSGGILTMPLGQRTLGAGLLQQPDRHLLAAGSIADAVGNNRFFVTRHLLARCGDSVTGGDEACDDGGGNGDGCDDNCTLTACGNGIVTAGEACDDGNLIDGDGCSPTCETQPTHTPTATRTATPTLTPTVTRTPTITRTPSLTATGTAISTRTNTRTQTATRTGTATSTATDTPTSVDTATATPTESATPTASDTATATSTPTAHDTTTPTATPSAIDTPTPTAADTGTTTPTVTPSASATASATDTPTPTASTTPTAVSTVTASPSATLTFSPTPTASGTASPTETFTPTAIDTATATAMPTVTPPPSATSTATDTATPTAIDTASATPSRTPTGTPSPSPTPTATATPSASATPTELPSATPVATPAPPTCLAPTGANPCIPGGGSSRTDCRLELALPLPAPANGKLVCYEGDPACDAEPAPGDGGCTIAVRLCLNNADPRLPLCGAQTVEGLEIKLPRAGRGDAADAANLASLESQVGAFGVSLYRGGQPAVLGVPIASPDLCGAPTILQVPLRAAGSGRVVTGKRSLVLQARWPGSPVDADRFKLQCRPSTCGNGRVESHEQCDDDNRLAGDGCSPACRIEP